MNYSKPMRKKDIGKRLLAILIVCFLFGLVIGVIFGMIISGIGGGDPPTIPPEPIETGATIPDTESPIPSLPPIQTGPINQPITEPEPDPEPQPVLLGTFRITAYCACEKCCGEWAKNRPNGIVYGAYGIELKAGVSCASPLPRGTVVIVEGLGEYVVQDKIAKWVIDKYGENQVDIYFDSHEAACEFGLRYLEVYLKEEG